MSKNNIQLLITLGVISASVFVVIIIVLANNNPKQETLTPTATPTVTASPTPTAIIPTGTGSVTPTTEAKTTYKNGIYSSKISYFIPRGGQSTVDLSVTIKDDVVTVANNTYTHGDRESIEYQEWFEQAYKEVVVGKKINDIALSRVGGASLTTAAFMQALTNVASQARN